MDIDSFVLFIHKPTHITHLTLLESQDACDLDLEIFLNRSTGLAMSFVRMESMVPNRMGKPLPTLLLRLVTSEDGNRSERK
jgi:hypothetical protein